MSEINTSKKVYLFTHGRMDLNEKSIEASYALKARFGNDWLGEFMNGDIEDLAAKTGSHAGTLEALKCVASYLNYYEPPLPSRSHS